MRTKNREKEANLTLAYGQATSKIRLHVGISGRGLDPPEDSDVEYKEPDVRALQVL